jgi:hypothetical protein
MHVDARRTPVHLWVVGIVSLLWNAVGAFGYLATQLGLDGYMGQYTDAQRAYYEAFPSWAVAFWALGVWGAVFGSVALLLRRRWAVALYALSLIGLIGSSVFSFLLSDGAELMGAAGSAFSAVIFIVAVLLLVYARRMSAAGVLR